MLSLPVASVVLRIDIILNTSDTENEIDSVEYDDTNSGCCDHGSSSVKTVKKYSLKQLAISGLPATVSFPFVMVSGKP